MHIFYEMLLSYIHTVYNHIEIQEGITNKLTLIIYYSNVCAQEMMLPPYSDAQLGMQQCLLL